MRAALLTLLLTSTLHADINNLIASPDGRTVYFNAQAGPNTTRTYVLREGQLPGASDFAPADVAGTALVSTWRRERYCGFGGSTCFIAPTCQAGIEVRQNSTSILTNSGRTGFARLDPTGNAVWFEQPETADCLPMGITPTAPRNGLYTLDGTTRLIPRGTTRLATHSPGRRAITQSSRVLVFEGPQLQWLAPNAGPVNVRHTAGAYEAVTDSAGRVVVYSETAGGRLHWIETSPFNTAGTDIDLGLNGLAPALSGDGTTLAWLTPQRELVAYNRAANSTRRLLPDREVITFTLSDTAAFAATQDNSIIRIDLATGSTTTLLARLPEITAIDAPTLPVSRTCPLICYGTPEPGYFLSPGMLLYIHGRNLDATTWTVELSGAPNRFPTLTPLNPETAWLQVPSSSMLPGSSSQKLNISSTNTPVFYTNIAEVTAQTAVCLGTIHQDFGHLVTAADPAVSGEVVHIFLTGLGAAVRIPIGQPNPTDRLIPVVNPPGINQAFPDWTPVFFGLAPGLIGIQQLDLRIGFQIPASRIGDLSLFTAINQLNCKIPPLARSELTPEPPGDIH